MSYPPVTTPLVFRIMIVDNNSASRDSNRVVVEALDCEPIVAQGEGRSLRDNAKQRARQKRCHVALVDMRLVDDKDPSDKSGLELISHLLPARSLVVSGSDEGKDRTDAATMDEAREKGAVGYAKKGDPALHVKILGVLHKYWNWSLDYDFAKTRYNPEKIIAHLDLGNTELIPPDEVDSLLRQAYNEGEVTLDLESIEGPYDSTESATSFRRSVVLFAMATTKDDGIQRREIVKFAPRDHIDREVVNYRKHVRRLQHQYTALIEHDPVLSWDMGLIRYTDETTGDRNRFIEWYRDSDTEQVTRSILHLFREVLKPWYDLDSGGENKSSSSVYGYYTTPELFRKLGSQIDTFASRGPLIKIENLAGNFINPAHWAEKHRDMSKFSSRWQALTHGDLHSGNIIVDKDNRCYIIDYERTGRGFYLRDFVELEKDIRLRLFRLEDGRLDLALHLDCLLMAQESVDSLPTWREPPVDSATEPEVEEIHKAFEAICTIRQAAQEIGHLERMDEYYWALLMETLLSVTDPRIGRFAHQRALLSASLICERLERWRNPHKTWSSLDRCSYLKLPSGSRSESSQSVPPVAGYALLIGVGQTKYDPPLSLPTTVNDAEALKAVLVDPASCVYSPERVHVLSNEIADLPRIRTELQWLADQTTANPDSTAIVYFSGHGGHLQADDRYFLVPSNFDPNDIRGSVLWASEFTQKLRDIKAKRVLVLIDACHAAGMAAAKETGLLCASGFIETPPPEDLLKSWQLGWPPGSTKQTTSTPRQGEGRAIISSSRGDQSSYVRKDGTLSIFTYHLLQALRGEANKPGDTSITVSTLIGHLRRTVPVSAQRDWNKNQQPWTDFTGEDFAITALGGALDGLSASPQSVPGPNRPVTVFYSYAHKDEKLRDRLEKHLSILKREGVIANWHDRRISAGREWEGAIDEHLRSAEIVLLLVSADFLASDYCYDVEMKLALERHNAGEVRVIPIILRSVEWKGAPFGKLSALPTDGKPVMEWKPSDKGFQDVARGIRVTVGELRASQP